MNMRLTQLAAALCAAAIALPAAAREFRSSDVHPDDYPTVMAVNYMSDIIKQKTGGSIILISSTGSLVGFNGLAAYGASKGGVDQLCRQLAVEWGPHDIRVNCVNPGYTTHNMRGTDTRHAAADLNEEMRRMTPMQRRGTPEEMAAPVVFLASPAASFISGVVIPVDGGYCAM